MPRKRRADEYEDDEGPPAARSKKVRKEASAAKKKNVNKNGDNKDGADSEGKKSKGKKVPGDGNRDSKGEEFWEVSVVLFYLFMVFFDFVCLMVRCMVMGWGLGGDLVELVCGQRVGEKEGDVLFWADVNFI